MGKARVGGVWVVLSKLDIDDDSEHGESLFHGRHGRHAVCAGELWRQRGLLCLSAAGGLAAVADQGGEAQADDGGEAEVIDGTGFCIGHFWRFGFGLDQRIATFVC